MQMENDQIASQIVTLLSSVFAFMPLLQGSIDVWHGWEERRLGDGQQSSPKGVYQHNLQASTVVYPQLS